ncbi:MAG: CRISPR-associated endonuclease Cas2 [Granulosicoccus sp.]
MHYATTGTSNNRPSGRRLYLAAYDIANAKRLRAALYCLREYATGGQLSVHECWLSDTERTSLIISVNDIIDVDEDRFLLVKLDTRQHVTSLGKAIQPEDPDWFYVG